MIDIQLDINPYDRRFPNATCIAPEMAYARFQEKAPAIRARHGFLTKSEVADIRAFDRLRQVLVRCGMCRFRCAVQDLEHLEKCIVAGGDYIRDVSLPIGDEIYTGHHNG